MKWLQGFWAVWGMVVFTLLMLLALPFYIVAIAIWGDKAIVNVHGVSRIWARGIFLFTGIRTRRIAPTPLRKGESYVLVSNHLSALDIPLCAVASPVAFRFLSKAELGRVPLLGWIIRNIYLTVDRQNPKARQQSMERMKEVLAQGVSLFIYPEGTRNISAEPTARFYDGAFRLAIESKKPIAILVIANTNALCPARGFALRPGKLVYQWLTPISTEGYAISDTEALRDTVKNLINEALTKLRK
ncbi:MAG: 1-acyl-sn-glycerol-3-phosphate acyltransferase [Bacteroidetes bacterium]|jgi:1-acyl-sn-glycerol-3-phosphate acyltransferase|nr:1-acyl-sn-glycerol-3-phosphate acyltransferase [Bacteroidota bacterium]